MFIAGYAKAEYTVGYFTEMGIGCRRDPLEANVWYVRAADQGNETARQRLAIIRAAASGDPGIPMSKVGAKSKDLAGKKKFMGIF
jgi:TPR repeat protein